MTTNTRAPLDLQIAATDVRSFYARVSALGFGLIALTGIIALIWSLATGDTSQGFVFSLVFIIVGLLVAGLVWRFGRWALVLAGVLSFLLLALVGPFSPFELSHPESAGDFIPVVLLLAGALLGFVGSIGAIVQWRRKTSRAIPTSSERLVLGIVLGAVALAALLSIVLTLTGRTAVAAEAKTGATSVQMKNFTFAPNTLQVKAGDTVRLVVRNDDSTLHTFTMPQAGVNVSVPPGSEKLVEFKAPVSGTYQWYCIPHSDSGTNTRTGMVGTLIVP